MVVVLIMELLDSALSFIYSLELSEKLEFAYRLIDALYYFVILRVIILVPLLILIGFLITKFFLKENGSIKDDLIRLYIVFIFLFAIGLSGDVIIVILGGLTILGNLYRLINYNYQTKAEAQEKILEKLNEINEKLK